jgi:hypothetical protein
MPGTRRIPPTLQPFLAVVRVLDARLGPTAVPWAFTGSLSLALHGLPVVPRDIDLQTDKAGAYAIEQLFLEFVTRPVAFSAAERIQSHFGALTIEGVQVEIMGDVQTRRDDGTWEVPADPRRHTRVIEIEGLRLPVVSLDYAKAAYSRLDRVERAAMVREWLQAQRGATGGAAQGAIRPASYRHRPESLKDYPVKGANPREQ